jgi:hypothetical protein
MSGRLVHGATVLGAPLFLSVRNRRIRIDQPVGGPGGYRAIVEFADQDQGGSKAAAFMEENPVRRWVFDFVAWGDQLMSQLGRCLEEVDELSKEALEVIERFLAASATAEGWEGLSQELDTAAASLVRKFSQAEARKVYPAAVGEMDSIIRYLKGCATVFTFPDGKFAGPASYRQRPLARDDSREGFAFDDLKKDIEEARVAAGRELALWILKDLRRAGPRGLFQDALRDHAKHPGVAEFAERLERAASGLEEDLEALEEDIRLGNR